MRHSPPPDAPFASGSLAGALSRERDVRSRRPALAIAYELWLDSWEAALSALVAATEGRTLSTNAAAAHKAVIAAERELVTIQFTRLLGHDPTRR